MTCVYKQGQKLNQIWGTGEYIPATTKSTETVNYLFHYLSLNISGNYKNTSAVSGGVSHQIDSLTLSIGITSCLYEIIGNFGLSCACISFCLQQCGSLFSLP